MSSATPGIAFVGALFTTSLMVVAGEHGPAPEQPIAYDHAQHLAYFAESHREEMLARHLEREAYSEEEGVPEALDSGDCERCHDVEEDTRRVVRCFGCHEHFTAHNIPSDSPVRACVGCHSGVLTGERATLPPAERCGACHPSKRPGDGKDTPLATYIESGEAIPWVPVYDYLPGDIVFSHERHAMLGKIGCEHCHPGVRAEPGALALRHELIMEDCMRCHDAHEASNDCLACHK